MSVCCWLKARAGLRAWVLAPRALSTRGSSWTRSFSEVAAVGKSSSGGLQSSLEPNPLVFNQEHSALRESLRKIIDKEINPFVDEWEEAGEFPAHTVFKTLGQAGFLGVDKPTEYGGMGLDFSYTIAVAEELGNIYCAGIPMAIGVQANMATPALARFGSDELKHQFLAPTISGDIVACLGISEVEAGSDVASIKTTAMRKGDDYVINGGKMWITNGCQADWMCLLANTSDTLPHRNKSLICLPMKLPGIHIAKKIDKMGMRSSDTAQIFFEDVRVPCKYLIGEENMGFTYQMLQFQEERMWGAANALTILENVINGTIDYTRQRKIFSKPVLHNQIVHFRLAELATELELLRSLLYRTVALYIKGNDVTKFASMAKLKAGRLAREVTDGCLQFWGGMGFTNEVLVSRVYRDARLMSIGGGADEVMLSVICKYMDTLPRQK
ncbi:LOW QUALITY PROTEIN: probable acyl-CoA dehydrogenase 6 [Rhinatrema bivittatum]|uniref:LOW QUALITY PROTEIN: probable acyl-CoA dehydrogenase 6 n=1 Tax=Rhinatrema bivittatum TaxID=194408 RepID=UPI0011295507|nr:LOW QUALITY PROTEIN: probable acyl-CoA dehydrogenase 6 [Rhinatrema bivittatum]